MHPSIDLSSWRLDPDGAILREPPRPPAYRGPDYEQYFDFTTVFCDAFWSADGDRIILIGPPLRNLEQELGVRFVSKPANVPCEHVVHHRDRVDRIEVAAPPGTERLAIGNSLGEIELAPQPSLEGLFRGKRVILTKNKNNDLAWIHDWALFHRRRHGCDAVLIYDNGSTRYERQDIADVLGGIDGLDQVAVIDWPFPWGVEDFFGDSMFSQSVALEHARQRCLSGAKSVLQGDVDELVLTKVGESVFELAESSESGYLRYGGLWVETVKGNGIEDSTSSVEPLRHRNFHHVLEGKNHRMGPKWTCVPAKAGRETLWSLHRVIWDDFRQGAEDEDLSARISLRHFKAINTGWKVGRATPETLDPKTHRVDHELKAALDAVFASCSADLMTIKPNLVDRTGTVGTPSSKSPTDRRQQLEALAYGNKSMPAGEREKIAEQLVRESPDDPGLWLLLGMLQKRHGNIDDAASSLREAIKLDSSFAPVHGMLGGIYARQGMIQDAILATDRAIELDPRYDIGYRRLSQLYAQQGRIDEAIEATRKVLEINPRDPNMQNHIGNLLERQGALDEAIAAQLEAVDLGMDNAGICRRLAALLARRGDYGEAIKYANRALMHYGARHIMGNR